MPLRFNMLLEEIGLAPRNVRLLRHQTNKVRGRTPYALWRDEVEAFERYQSTQDPRKRNQFAAPYWASFVSPPSGGTLFVGLFEVSLQGSVAEGTIDPLTGEAPGAGKSIGPYDQYQCRRSPLLAEYEGRLLIQWGVSSSSYRAWVQYADRQDKEIIELSREFQEEPFPGYTRFNLPLSDLQNVPPGWKEALRAVRGIYLLVCPLTREHYVGAAVGTEGFWGRWSEYVASGHGGNVALRNRTPSDYTASILEVAGSSATVDDILGLEASWKAKLLSRAIGLNRN